MAVVGAFMSVGQKAGISLALGMATGSFTWAMLTALGLSKMLATYATAITVIRVVGGLYLLWLTCKEFKSAASTHEVRPCKLDGKTRSLVGYAIRGYIIPMMNPKTALT